MTATNLHNIANLASVPAAFTTGKPEPLPIPVTQPPVTGNIPDELKVLPHWIVWRYENKFDEKKGTYKLDKIPYQVNGRHAKTNDKTTWSTFSAAVQAAPRYSGIGFQLNGSPFVGIDFDGVLRDGIVEPYVSEIVRLLGNPYTEVTPSGNGLRTFVRGELPQGKRKFSDDSNGKYGVEVYSGTEGGRYLTVTGNKFPGNGSGIPSVNLTLPYLLCTRFFDERFRQLWMGDTSEYGCDDSRADLALCSILAREFINDRLKIETAFGESELGQRDKWVKRADYRKMTIDKAVAGNNTTATATVEVPVVDERELESPTEEPIPVFPTECVDGDYIGDLTRHLTDGTPIPPTFVRENCKTILGALVDGTIGYPNHESIHTRQYTFNVSPLPNSGKGESWIRTGAFGTGWLNAILSENPNKIVHSVDGGLFGSGQFLVKILEEKPWSIVYFDEMSELFEKDKMKGSILEKKLLTLFESTVASQGSFSNGLHESADIHLNFVGNFTVDGFEASFAGRGSRGSGFLSRVVFSYSNRMPHTGDWAEIDSIAARKTLNCIRKCLSADFALKSNGRFIPEETEAAQRMRLEFFDWLGKQDARYTSRLDSHMKRDLLLRCSFSKDKRITGEMMGRAIAWAKYQLEVRTVLWPQDSGSALERMEHSITAALQKYGNLSERDLLKKCHVERPGSGGHDTFRRAIFALQLTGRVEIMAKTRKGRPVYGLVQG